MHPAGVDFSVLQIKSSLDSLKLIGD